MIPLTPLGVKLAAALSGKTLAADLAGGGMLLSGVALLLMQDAAPPVIPTNVIGIIAQAFSLGGVGYVLITRAAAEIAKSREAQRKQRAEELAEEVSERRIDREEDRAQRQVDREQFARWVDRYIEREGRVATGKDAEVAYWRQCFEKERERSERLVEKLTVQVVGNQNVEKQVVVKKDESAKAET